MPERFLSFGWVVSGFGLEKHQTERFARCDNFWVVIACDQEHLN
jgi:hypothetical protein